MTTRGAYIGEIVDAFAAISEQIKLRNQFNMTELSVFAEGTVTALTQQLDEHRKNPGDPVQQGRS